jgi:hypothetical protein
MPDGVSPAKIFRFRLPQGPLTRASGGRRAARRYGRPPRPISAITEPARRAAFSRCGGHTFDWPGRERPPAGLAGAGRGFRIASRAGNGAGPGLVRFGCTQSDQGVWPCTRVYADIDDAAASTLPASCLVLLEYAYRGRCSPEGAGSGSDRIRACQGAITPRH